MSFPSHRHAADAVIPGDEGGPASVCSGHPGAGQVHKYMYEVSSCRPARAELDHRWGALRQALEVITARASR
ncbi:hypothetical protein STRTUCAR8_01431 [Streptomyces turgidiscabies Car8]|uniref:Uncharacterized protein n=1 Tax=Streptomyces turgidiscabies (strain Car8) TaxID=698760 RepID=L7F407_STRT8|nr:hypothetical protein STRTUCAR8_01431 [Streptomyces turgidiscabies Car8]